MSNYTTQLGFESYSTREPKKTKVFLKSKLTSDGGSDKYSVFLPTREAPMQKSLSGGNLMILT
ncbi:MAG: hypothetical protein AAF443_00060 [Chlamydiota bacterium]